MLIVRSKTGVPLRLTEERWRHIVQNHPEVTTLRDQILETVAHPDVIQEGDYGELLALRFYPETPLSSKYLVVAYKELGATDGFILTAYLARRASGARETIWKR